MEWVVDNTKLDLTVFAGESVGFPANGFNIKTGDENDFGDPTLDQRVQLPFEQRLSADIDQRLRRGFRESKQALTLTSADNQCFHWNDDVLV